MAITKELVFAAADALAEHGQKPTMANVRKELGGKGMSYRLLYIASLEFACI